ncbi:hypothetical protein B0H13DRAFT_1875111 [Mycena leptocephala]|nr:hypothetical protein B0H13DRAFT_1875111 [Mycena leptocephala]
MQNAKLWTEAEFLRPQSQRTECEALVRSSSFKTIRFKCSQRGLQSEELWVEGNPQVIWQECGERIGHWETEHLACPDLGIQPSEQLQSTISKPVLLAKAIIKLVRFNARPWDKTSTLCVLLQLDFSNPSARTKCIVHPSIKKVLGLANVTMNKSYSATDMSNVYRIAMGTLKMQCFKSHKWDETWITTAKNLVSEEYETYLAAGCGVDEVEIANSDTASMSSSTADASASDWFGLLDIDLPSTLSERNHLEQYLNQDVIGMIEESIGIRQKGKQKRKAEEQKDGPGQVKKARAE